MKTIVALSDPLSKAQARKLDSFACVYNSVMRKAYVALVVKKQPIAQYKRFCISTFNLNGRHFNSLKIALMGKVGSVLELNKEYIENTQLKIKDLQKDIAKKEAIVASFKKRVILPQDRNLSVNLLSYSLSMKDRKALVNMKNKLVRLNNKLAKLLLIKESRNPQLCFGSKQLLKRRTTGYFKTHKEWLEEWRFQRNKEVCFVGSHDESCGNLNAGLRHIHGNRFALKLNVNPKASVVQDKFVELYFNLNYEVETLKKILLNIEQKTDSLGNAITQPLTIRVTKEKNSKKRDLQYKLAISFEKYKQVKIVSNDAMSGCIGVDINQDHLAICETNHQGNYVDSWRVGFVANKDVHSNINSIALSVKKLVALAKERNKPIVLEDLDFSKKKRELKANYNKTRNIQLISFAYNKVGSLIKARAEDAGIEVLEVNPAYTSVIGEVKYSKRLNISIHKSAAYAIARRGMKIKEKEKVSQLDLSESERKKLKELEGYAYWCKTGKLMKAKKLNLERKEQKDNPVAQFTAIAKK